MDLKTLFTPVVDSSQAESTEARRQSALDSHFERAGVNSRRIRDGQSLRRRAPQRPVREPVRRVIDEEPRIIRRRPRYVKPTYHIEDEDIEPMIQLPKVEIEEVAENAEEMETSLFDQVDAFKVHVNEDSGQGDLLRDYTLTIATPLSDLFTEAWDIVTHTTPPDVNVWTDWVDTLNGLTGKYVKSITTGDDSLVLYEYKPIENDTMQIEEVESEIGDAVKTASDDIISKYSRAVSQLNASARRTILDNLPAHLRRRTLRKIKDAQETSESDELAALISEYILTQDESTLNALLLKRVEIDSELKEALDFVLDFPNNELLVEDVVAGTSALVTYFELNETEVPAFELMVSEEAQADADEEIIKQEKENLKEDLEDSVLDDVIDEGEDSPDHDTFPAAKVPESESDSEVAKILTEAGIEFVDVNGYIIVKDDAPQTLSERIQQVLPAETDISLPVMDCADYHTVMDTKERRKNLLRKLADSKTYEGLSDTAKVITAALQSGDFATADSRFYKKTLTDTSWITDAIKIEDVPKFLDEAIKDSTDKEVRLEISENEIENAKQIKIGSNTYFVIVTPV